MNIIEIPGAVGKKHLRAHTFNFIIEEGIVNKTVCKLWSKRICCLRYSGIKT